MNDDKIKGQWKQLADRAKAKWGKLTDDDLKIVDGNQEYLTGMVQERYSITKDEAKKQVEEFGRTLERSARWSGGVLRRSNAIEDKNAPTGAFLYWL